MGITERKERERREMRELILNAAMGLFVETGYEEVSIRRIAEKIEYSPATIYLYFKDRDEILYGLHLIAFDALYRAQSTTQSIENPLERLRAHGEVYVLFGLEHPELYDLMFIMRGPARKIVVDQEWEIGRRSYELLRADVRACLDAGLIASTQGEDAIAFSLWSLVHGMVALNIRNRCAMIPREHRLPLVRQALDFVMSSIGSGS